MTTIASEIQRIKTNIANTYTVLEEKGATLPETLNSANLATCANSISGGGGTVRIPNFTKHGAVSVVDEIASNFSDNNYIDCGTIQIPSGSTWDFRFKFNSGDSGYQLVGGFGTENNKGMAVNLSGGYLSYYISSDGSGWDIASGSSASLSLTNNTDYYMRRYFTGTQYKLDISTTGEFNGEEINYITVDSSTSINSNSMGLYLGTWLNVGNSPMDGNIDLSTVKLYIDNTLVYTCYEEIQGELTTKTIVANGTYNAQDDLAIGYSSVTVNVPQSGGGTTLYYNPNYTTSPNLNNNYFVYSGFSDSYYIECPTFQPDQYSWEIGFAATFKDTTSGGTLISMRAGYSKFLVDAGGGNFNFYLGNGSGSNDWNIANGISTSTLTVNTKYYVKVAFDSTQHTYTFFISTDKETWTIIYTVNSDQYVSNDSQTTIIGNSYNGSYHWNAQTTIEMDMKEFYYEINGERTYQALDTMQNYHPMKTARATKFSQNGFGETVNIQIDSNGIASGFNSNDFLQYPFLVTNAPWELTLCISVTSFEGVLCSNSFGSSIGQNFCLWLDSYTNKIFMGIDNNGSWTDVAGSTALNTNQYYYVKLTYDSKDLFSLYTSSDGINYTKEFDYTCTLNCNGILNVGIDYAGSNGYLRGSVDLTHSNLKINNEVYNFI